MEIELDCGCKVQHGVASEHDYDLADQSRIDIYGREAAKCLAYWASSRFAEEDRHRCELVSDENPYGLTPR